ncbi:hypothetical protein [Paenibacillus cucumis (ex Kampfer et al. 2016)]|uniref:Uncharacterized protein n=1 Tax=Paenibacillus cucumis (ex Kampfer et al. 2016) TaxID=1776858 RepID=A0ABS7KML1_9BACL|nr:hypothetical protein [Paenibacillus cucumis (ex Kampfer et al. 2016)]MBY0205387.1 hypothetical protein [Paenibacillus cucumis (ex Kampfer et al. 2016)]
MKKRPRSKRRNIGHCLSIFLSMIICFALLSIWPTAHAAATTNRFAPASVEQFAQLQVNALGTSNPDWLVAKLEYYPLGPGNHGWFVHASIQDKPVGYMIISTTPQGQLLLSEYGQGEQSLYNNELLGQALERQGLDVKTLQTSGGKLTLLYAPPLLAYWKVERVNHPAMYIDASNGDLLPVDQLERVETGSGTKFFELKELQQQIPILEPTRLQTSPVILQPAFDPSSQLTWLTSEPLQPSQVKQQLQQNYREALVFSAEEWNLFYGGPLPVSGYQIWSIAGSTFDLYVGLGGYNSTQRFIPLNKLLHDGHFYKFNS